MTGLNATAAQTSTFALEDSFASRSKFKKGHGVFGKHLYMYLAVVILCIVAPMSYYGLKVFYFRYAEWHEPVIELVEAPEGIGGNRRAIRFKVVDRHSGIANVKVSIAGREGEPLRDLASEDMRGSGPIVWSKEYEVGLPSAEDPLPTGNVQINIFAQDRSLWGNTAHYSKTMLVDYDPPKLRLLTPWLSLPKGGSALVLYEVADESRVFTGLQLNDRIFPGFKARLFDRDFDVAGGVYMTFVPLPLDMENGSEPMVLTVFARDEVGNRNEIQVPLKIGAQVGLGKRRLDWTNAKGKIQRAFELYMGDERGVLERRRSVPQQPTFSEMLSFVFDDYMPLARERLRESSPAPLETKLWENRFYFAPVHEPLYGFGDSIDYVVGQESFKVNAEESTFFRSDSIENVTAANNGVVVFAGPLEPFGKTVVIDHGFGISTLYSGLSDIKVSAGTRIPQGGLLGQTGSSGLAPYGGVEFELHIHGVPTDPMPWVNREWLRDSVLNVLDQAKLSLGIRSTSSTRRVIR